MEDDNGGEKELQKLEANSPSPSQQLHDQSPEKSMQEKTIALVKTSATSLEKGAPSQKNVETNERVKSATATSSQKSMRSLKEHAQKEDAAPSAKRHSITRGELIGPDSKSLSNSEEGSSEENDKVGEMPAGKSRDSRRPISDAEQLENVVFNATQAKQDLGKKVNDLGIHEEIAENSDEDEKSAQEEDGGEADDEWKEKGKKPGWKDYHNIRSVSAASNYGSNDDSIRGGSPEGDDMLPKPRWHPPWQLKQEIVAHEAAIPVLIIDPTNRWFATGSSDNLIRIWDIENYRLKLMIKAHKQSLRSMAFGKARHRYLYSTGDDRQLLCHDVEVNRVISRYKGQSSVIYCMCMHTTPSLLVTGARDKLLKLYDTRTTKCVRQLRGHQNTVSCVLSIHNTEQIISGSHDGTLRVWDVGEGKCTGVLYGHSKSIRTMCQHPVENSILSASSERILAWDIKSTRIVQEIPAKDIAINSITINRLGVTVAGGSNGVMHLWDYPSGFRFQKIHRNKVYESQEIPICVFATKFDLSGTKLLCSGACNVVKIYQEAFTRFRPYVDRPLSVESENSLRNASNTPNPADRSNR